MTLEHSPKPGATWERRTVRREVIVPDGPWDGAPVVVSPWPTATEPPRLNRATRRALARTAKKGHRR